MLNELEQKIRKAIPELMELGVGCIFRYKDSTKNYIITQYDLGKVSFNRLEEFSNPRTEYLKDILNTSKIIGKPIQLNHVLEYLSMLGFERFVIDMYGGISERIGKFPNTEYLLRTNWNLKSNLLSDQSEAMCKYLLDLKKD